MPILKYLHNIVQIHVTLLEQNKIMKKQIGGLTSEEIIVAVFGFNHQLYGFLPYFLGNFVYTFLEKTTCIR